MGGAARCLLTTEGDEGIRGAKKRGPSGKAALREDGGATCRGAQPATSPLGILLLVAAIYLVVTSPKKLRTLVRMAIGFVGTALLIMVAGAILRRGDQQALGAIAGLVAMLAAVTAGWWDTRALKRDGGGTPEPPSAKP